MNTLTIGEIEKAVDGRILQGNRNNVIDGVCTDSRKAQRGNLFVPLIGEVHDAHKFLPQVIEAGCRAVLVSDEAAGKPWTDCDVIGVSDTTRALQSLAKYYLKKLNLKKIAVTGSVGKTSTRDMVYYILSEKYKTGRTEGNFNNDIGVPLTIFSFDDSMEAAVLETGMDHAGEIHRLVDIIRPDIGIITNVGISHIENLGSRQGILNAKLEITDFFGPDNALVINQSNDMLGNAEISGEFEVIRVGTEGACRYSVSNISDYGEAGIEYRLETEEKEYEVKLNIPGAHNAVNSALAIAACERLGVTVEEALRGLSKIRLTGKRLTVRECRGIKVIDDTYNAAPDSMKSAIATLIHTKGDRKIAILGDMNELGADSAEYHKEIGRFAGEMQADLLIAVGPKAIAIAEGGKEILGKDKVLHFDTKEELYPKIDGLFKAGDVIIVKASRTMEMEQIVERIVKE